MKPMMLGMIARRYPSAIGGDKLLVIHTPLRRVSKKDLDKAREVARNADLTDNPVNAMSAC